MTNMDKHYEIIMYTSNKVIETLQHWIEVLLKPAVIVGGVPYVFHFEILLSFLHIKHYQSLTPRGCISGDRVARLCWKSTHQETSLKNQKINTNSHI